MDAVTARPQGDLPRLAVLYEASSVQAFHLVEASAETWRTVWVVDRDLPGSEGVMRLLSRFGPVVDVTSMDDAEVARALRPYDISGIVAFDDSLLPRAAFVAQELALPFMSPEVTHRVTDKLAQREAFRAAGVPTPRSARIPASGTAVEWVRAAASIDFPAVAKPVSGNGSRDVYALQGFEDLVALMSTRAARGAAGDMVVEERIPDAWVDGERPYGDFVTVETFVSHGTMSHFGVTGCMPLAEPFRLTGNFQPSALRAQDTEAAVRAAEDAIRALGADTGVFHTEVKLSPVGFRVVEVNGRLGGGGVPRIAELATGRSLLNATGRVALGQQVDVSGAEFARVGYFYRFQPPVGARTLVSIDGLDEVRAFPGMREVVLNRRPGDALGDVSQGTRGFIYSVHGTVDSHEALWRMMERVRTTVSVVVD